MDFDELAAYFGCCQLLAREDLEADDRELIALAGLRDLATTARSHGVRRFAGLRLAQEAGCRRRA